MNGKIIQFWDKEAAERSVLCVCSHDSNIINTGFTGKSGSPAGLTKWGDNWANNAVGHDNSEDAHHPGVGCPKVELTGLVLKRHNEIFMYIKWSI